MNFDFELILVYGTLITGVIYLFDVLFLAKRRRQKYSSLQRDEKLPIIIDYARSFFPVLCIVLLLRSFLFEPFRIPTPSLEPSLLTGDFIVLNKFDYGLRLPVWRKLIYPIGEPQRGDIMVFRWPADTRYYFIKRVIGVPGDHISYVNKILTINGKKIPQTLISTKADGVQIKEEDLLGVKHKIYSNPHKTTRDYTDIVVPAGMYFMMGDNRDDSADGRYFGFTPEKDIVGKAVLVWLSWDKEHSKVRWDRFGLRI